MTAVEVVDARPSHYPILGELTVRAYEPVEPTMYEDGYADELADVATRAAEVPVLVALFNGFVIGGLTYVPNARSGFYEFGDPDGASFRHLAVDPSAQGLGAGRRLVEVVIDRARSAGRSRLLIHSLARMTAAQQLYRTLGFVRDESLDALWDTTHGLGFRLELGRPGQAILEP